MTHTYTVDTREVYLCCVYDVVSIDMKVRDRGEERRGEERRGDRWMDGWKDG